MSAARWHCFRWQHPDPDAGIGSVRVVNAAGGPAPELEPSLPVHTHCEPLGLPREGGLVVATATVGADVSAESNAVHTGYGPLVEVPEPAPGLTLALGVLVLVALRRTTRAAPRV